ncbi:MAG TPA: hypothetical protein VFR58_17155 [Flavisolibacter sp.]|nr:hypothetical protein [Flavisolibacter sp.]
MEINIATIQREQVNTHLVLQVNDQEFRIILTDDNPNNIKAVFNQLLKELKSGLFNFNLQDDTHDLYHHICKEYLVQLNAELKTIYQELSEYDLLEAK